MSELVKIPIAAKEIGVSVKTIYNWIEDGSLKMADKGFVYTREVELTYLKKQQDRSIWGKDRSKMFTRDEKGKFKLLTGGFNGKHHV